MAAEPTPPGAPLAGDWWALTQRSLQVAEYDLSAVEGAPGEETWQAPNRAHGWRAIFSADEVVVRPRIAGREIWEWRSRLAEWGREGQMEPAAAARATASAARFSVAGGGMERSWLNHEGGLELSLTMGQPPAAGDGRPLRLDFGLDGSVSLKVAGSGSSGRLVSASGTTVLRLAGLSAVDAVDRVHAVRLSGTAGPEGRLLRLEVDDADAVYPLTVSLVASSPTWAAGSSQAGAGLGAAVAAAGDVNGDDLGDIIIGAPFYDQGQLDEGKVWLYLGTPTGPAATPIWTAVGGVAGALMGAAVAGAGDVNGDGIGDVLVGGPGTAGEGRAWLYLGSPAGPATSPAWTQSGGQSGAEFGGAVAGAGDVDGDGYAEIMVGARGDNTGGSGAGRALIYRGGAASVGTVATWTLNGSQAGEHAGTAVAGAGDVNGDGYADLLLGSPDYSGGAAGEGRVCLYMGGPGGPAAVWSTSGGTAGVQLGAAAAVAGDVNGDGWADVAVGGPGDAAGAGTVRLFLGTATIPAPVPAWSITGAPGAALGAAVAGAGDINGDGYADLIVGSPDHDGTLVDEGRAELYLGSMAGLGALPAWSMDGGQAGARLGSSVAGGDTDGDGRSDILLGAAGMDDTQADEGMAFMFFGEGGTLNATATWYTELNRAVSRYGFAVSSAGDINGDGYSEVLVASPVYDDGELFEGKVFLYYGSSYGLGMTPAWSAEGNSTLAQFGFSVAPAGDVNGDGYGDVIIGAYALTDGDDDEREGGAFVYLGSPSGLPLQADWGVQSNRKGAQMGTSVAAAGDVNGDGYGDVIIGADLFTENELEEGRAYLYLGSPAGLGTAPVWTVNGQNSGANFGQSVASAGDVNGDGYSDVVVGAWLHDQGTVEGRVYVYHGSGGGLSQTAAWIVDGTQGFSHFGIAVSSAGDVNGDGYADIIIGANRHAVAGPNDGAAFVYHGSASGLGPAPAWTGTSGQDQAFFGESVAVAGDINGDGYADVIVGALGYDGDLANEGAAFVYYGSATGLSPQPGWIGEGNQASSWFGRSVASAGDINGDGYADIIVGAPFFDNGQQDEGQARVYTGNGDGLSLRPQQRRGDDVAPLVALAAINHPDGFRIALTGQTPYGRGRVKMEWEVKPLGVLFDGTGTQVSTAWTDTGTTGTALSELVTGLSANQAYHWRVRLRYDPATTPQQPASRWLTPPRGGWEEWSVSTEDPDAMAGIPGGAGVPGVPLTVDLMPGGSLRLTWSTACSPAVSDYEIYEGSMGDYESHVPRFCSTAGATTRTFMPAAGNSYYLVVPHDGVREGSYGRSSAGGHRQQGLSACRPMAVRACD